MIAWRLALAVAVLGTGADSMCTFVKTEGEFTTLGRLVHYCNYKGVKFLPGSQFSLKNCLKCTCRNEGLICCKFGAESRFYDYPFGCTLISDGCKPVFVKLNNRNLDCNSGLPIKVKQETSEPPSTSDADIEPLALGLEQL